MVCVSNTMSLNGKTKFCKGSTSKNFIWRGVGRNWDKPREAYLRSPKTLVELTAETLDSQPLPQCMFWTANRVLEWLEETVQLPQYKSCFKRNYINGRQLILIGPNHLIRMTIFSLDHIMKIMQHIRILYQVPRPKYSLDLTMPSLNGTEYDWNTLYYRYIARQTPHHAVPRSVYWRKAKMMNGRSEPPCHWYSISTGQEVEGKVMVARVNVNTKKVRYYMPMFREGNFLPTTIKVDYLDNDPLTW